MKVLLVEPEKRPRPVEVEGLEGMQELVGGLIAATYPWDDDVALVCNDDGIAEGLPLNRMVNWDTDFPQPIFGTFFICGLGEEDFESIGPEMEKKYKELFKRPEAFLRLGDSLLWSQKGGARKIFSLR